MYCYCQSRAEHDPGPWRSDSVTQQTDAEERDVEDQVGPNVACEKCNSDIGDPLGRLLRSHADTQ